MYEFIHINIYMNRCILGMQLCIYIYFYPLYFLFSGFIFMYMSKDAIIALAGLA